MDCAFVEMRTTDNRQRGKTGFMREPTKKVTGATPGTWGKSGSGRLGRQWDALSSFMLLPKSDLLMNTGRNRVRK